MGKSFRGADKKFLKEKFLAFREKRKKRRIEEVKKENREEEGRVRGHQSDYIVMDDDYDAYK